MTPPESNSSFVPITPNPFIVGNPVRDRNMFFGRKTEFEFVKKRFGETTRGGLLVFCGERRSGKTSILFQILDGRLGPDFIPVLIDMQSMAIENEIDFLHKISMEILETVGEDAKDISPPDFAPGTKPSSSFYKFVENILGKLPDRKIVLLFDEYELFENKIEAGVLTQDVLFIIASLMEKLSVFVVFTGSQHLEQRRHEYWRILGKSLYRSISYLNVKDAIDLIQKPVEGRVHYESGTVDQIHRLTAGQPFYTQAVCQNLVDHLNEIKSHHAGDSEIKHVVEAIVDNPLPQMIFLWDGLEVDQKLVLALLAEALENENDYADLGALTAIISSRKYPLNLSKPRIATALEQLFKEELLLKNNEDSPGYAFRMDLWRLWIKRMHSVWQVMREEGMQIRIGKWDRYRKPALLGGAVLLVLLAAFVVGSRRNRGDFEVGRPDPPALIGNAYVLLRADPGDALITIDGDRIARGQYQGPVTANAEHMVVVTADGYERQTLTLTLEAEESIERNIALEPIRGSLIVETDPPGARISLDGEPQGSSPVRILRLPVKASYRITAELNGYLSGTEIVSLFPDTARSVFLSLDPVKQSLVVDSSPPSARISIDGADLGRAPVTANIRLGIHEFGASLDGYVAIDTTLEVTQGIRQVKLFLEPEPPGVIVLLGDFPATIWVDGRSIATEVQNSGPISLRSGVHEFEVIVRGREPLKRTIEIRSGERIEFDYTLDRIVSRTPTKESR